MLLGPLSTLAQLDLREENVRIIEQNNFSFVEDTVEHRLYEHSEYDEQGRLLEKDRYLYESTDTGNSVALHERIRYNPRNMEGSVQTFRFPTPNRPEYEASEQKTLFKSYDHDQLLLWRKRMDVEGKMRLETRFTYDEKGQLVERDEIDYVYDHPIKRKDRLEYNDNGLRISWTAEDDSEAGAREVRDFKWTYDEQGRLIEERGFLNFRWKETAYKYKKDNLDKATSRMGARGPSGNIKYEYKILEKYDKKGRLEEVTEWEFGKKIRTKELSYEYDLIENEQIVTEVIEEQNGTRNTITRTEKQEGDRLKLKQVLENGTLEYEKRYQYRKNGTLKKEIERERQGNGALWKTITVYNEQELPLHVSYFIEGELRREERYRYEYYESEEK